MVEQLAKARSEGKLRENADFDDAREQLWMVDARIRYLERTLHGVTYLEIKEREEVEYVREELRQLEEIRLPNLVTYNQELSARISLLNVGSLRERLIVQKKETREKIEHTRKRIASIKVDLNSEISTARENYLRMSLLNLEATDLPRLSANIQNINRELKVLSELRKEYDNSRNHIENVNAQIRHLRNRLNTIISSETERQLQYELHDLVERRRPELALKLKVAVAQGDLKENADYHDAKEQLGFIEGRVKEIESILRNAIVVDNSESSDEVRIGSSVVIQEDGSGENEEYKIVGSAEANPRERKISEKSPIGSALIGAKVGDKVKVKTPDGVIKIKIVDIA